MTDQLVEITGDATGQIYQLDATFKLVDSASGKIVLQGKGIARAPYNRFQEIFANIRARYDAEEPRRPLRRRQPQNSGGSFSRQRRLNFRLHRFTRNLAPTATKPGRLRAAS